MKEKKKEKKKKSDDGEDADCVKEALAGMDLDPDRKGTLCPLSLLGQGLLGLEALDVPCGKCQPNGKNRYGCNFSNPFYPFLPFALDISRF